MGASGSPATCAAACRSGRVRAGRRWLAGPPDPRPRRSRCRAPRMRCRPWRPGVSVLVGAIQGARLIHQGGVVFNVGVVRSADASAVLGTRPGLDGVQDRFIRLGRSRLPPTEPSSRRQARAVEGITNRRKLHRHRPRCRRSPSSAVPWPSGRQLPRCAATLCVSPAAPWLREIAHVGGAAAAFLHRSPLFLCEVQRRSGWALRPHQSIGPNLDRSVIVVSFLANPPCGEQSRCADHDVGLFGDVVWGGVRPRLSTTWVSISTPSPYRGEGEVETCISVELSSTPADASSCLRPDHGDTPITSQALCEWECTCGWRLTVLGGRVAEVRWDLGG